MKTDIEHSLHLDESDEDPEMPSQNVSRGLTGVDPATVKPSSL
jgi:hypothetical protein